MSAVPAPEQCTILEVRKTLPEGIHGMAADARAEGHRFVDRLICEWETGENRFETAGERLLAVVSSGTLAGIGGLTVDPRNASAMRMRRFYVREQFRRTGLGRRLAMCLLESVSGSRPAIAVNAGSRTASQFWEALGFVRVDRDGCTHLYSAGAADR